MKKIFFILSIGLALYSQGQSTGSLKNIMMNVAATEVPPALLTATDVYWTISTVSTIRYVNTTPGSNYNTYRSGGGMIVKFKFLPDNRFEFLLYIQANSYGTDTETWTQVNGSVIFSKDAKGQPIFTTRAEKGVYRIVRNGSISTRAIPENELRDQHSNTYLWEQTNLKDDPENTYLLMVEG